MRIAIVTFHRAYNCGAMLQAWALKSVLERMGHVVEFPICNHVGESVRWQCEWVNRDYHGLRRLKSVIGRGIFNLMSIPSEDILRFRYKRFREKYIPERKCSHNEMGVFYDAIVVGSDQVWNVVLSGQDAPVFFAENVGENIRKIAYAASYGDKPLDDLMIGRVVSSLNRFSAVSVREPIAQQQLSALTQIPIDVTLDPTLLLSCSDYMAIEQHPYLVKEPYLFMYTLFASPFLVNTARKLAARLGVRCIIAPCYQYTKYAAPKGLTYSMSPDRLVGWTHNAKYIVAASFHGTALGVLYNKPLLSLRTNLDKYESRPAALLNKIGCGDRIVNPATSLDKMVDLLQTDLPLSCQEILDQERKKSLSWLRMSLA